VKSLLFAVSLGVTVLARALLLRPSPTRADSPDNDQSEIQIGYAITPVPLNLQGKDPALMGLGSYYVNAQGGCADCRSCPTYASGQNPFPPPVGVNGNGLMNAANFLAGGVPFNLPPPAGTIKSPNLTPDANGLPAGLPLAMFLNTIHTGADPNNPQQRLTIMPWPYYRFMTDRDLTAIYEYLSAIPHAEPGSCVVGGQ
jgi:hypothetical protein